MITTSVQAQTSDNLNLLRSKVSATANRVAVLPGEWTHGDWDHSHVVDEFVRKLGDVGQRLQDLEGLIDQYEANPEPSIFAKILSGLKESAGHMKGLESMTEQHLANRVAREEVFSDLIAIEDQLEDSINLVTADRKDE
jgi:hypothetical protein